MFPPLPTTTCLSQLLSFFNISHYICKAVQLIYRHRQHKHTHAHTDRDGSLAVVLSELCGAGQRFDRRQRAIAEQGSSEIHGIVIVMTAEFDSRFVMITCNSLILPEPCHRHICIHTDIHAAYRQSQNLTTMAITSNIIYILIHLEEKSCVFKHIMPLNSSVFRQSLPASRQVNTRGPSACVPWWYFCFQGKRF